MLGLGRKNMRMVPPVGESEFALIRYAFRQLQVTGCRDHESRPGKVFSMRHTSSFAPGVIRASALTTLLLRQMSPNARSIAISKARTSSSEKFSKRKASLRWRPLGHSVIALKHQMTSLTHFLP